MSATEEDVTAGGHTAASRLPGIPPDRAGATLDRADPLTYPIIAAWRARATMRWLALPGWAQVLVVYAATRVIAFVIINEMARFQAPSLWSAPNPGYLGVVRMWDADWYAKIVEHGYPSTIPRDSGGLAFQNEWAFYPLYPALVRVAMSLTGAGFALAATAVSLVLGAALVVLLRDLVARLAGDELAWWTVVLFCAFPVASVLQLAYTESLGILLLVCVLWCLQRGRYLLGIIPTLLLGLARPIAVPLAAVIGLHLLRLLLDRRRERPPPARLAAACALLGAAGIAAVEWPLIAGYVTGESHAYTDTMTAWRASHRLTLLRPWWDFSRYLLGDHLGPITLGVLIGGLLFWLSRPRSAIIAGDLRVWCLCYVGYLLAVLDPSTSIFRYLLPLFPLGTLAAAASRSAAYRRTLAVAFIAGQIIWVCWLWRFSPPSDWPP